MSVPSITPRVTVDTDHSCNYRCCFGCRCMKKVEPRQSPSYEQTIDTIEKTTHVYHRHSHNHHPEERQPEPK